MDSNLLNVSILMILSFLPCVVFTLPSKQEPKTPNLVFDRDTNMVDAHNYNVVFGHRNTVKGRNNVVIGVEQNVVGDNQVIIGTVNLLQFEERLRVLEEKCARLEQTDGYSKHQTEREIIDAVRRQSEEKYKQWKRYH